MTVILCIDERGGMMFGGKRQSRDRILRGRIIEKTKDARLVMNAYTASQFEEEVPNGVTAENVFETAGENDYVFIENIDVSPYDALIDSFIIYKWNRLYPSDFSFRFPLEESGYKLITSEDFEGSSHECITEEVYVR